MIPVWQPLHGPRREKTCLRRFANNKGADQPAHQRSLISAFVFRLLESVIFRLATSGFSICSCADWFESHFVGTPEDRFSRGEANIIPKSTLHNHISLRAVTRQNRKK